MAIDSVGRAGSAYNQAVFGAGMTRDLQDQFMKILITQLRYQDPMEPLKEHEFLAQMAQFSSATQIGELNKTVSMAMEYLIGAQANQSLLTAASLIGNTFIAQTADGPIEGVIESVVFEAGGVMVKYGRYLIPVDNIVYIGGKPEVELPEEPDVTEATEVPAEGQVEEHAGQGS